MQKARRHHPKMAPTPCRHVVSGTFHSPSGVLFTFPSRYLFTIGCWVVFSLTQWFAHQFTRGSTYPVLLGDPLGFSQVYSTGLSPSLAACSKAFLYHSSCHIEAHTTERQASRFWAVPLSLAATYGIAFAFFSSAY